MKTFIDRVIEDLDAGDYIFKYSPTTPKYWHMAFSANYDDLYAKDRWSLSFFIGFLCHRVPSLERGIIKLDLTRDEKRRLKNKFSEIFDKEEISYEQRRNELRKYD